MRGPPETRTALLAERRRENLDQTSTTKIEADTGRRKSTQPAEPLANEWMAAATAAMGPHFDMLVGRGVSKAWLWSGPMRFGVASIDTYRDGTFQPNPDGGGAFVIPAAPVPDEGVLFEEHDPEDLIAFTLREPERWWLRLNISPILNPAAVERADWLREPLKLWRSPLSWLRAKGEGAVVLDPVANLRLWLGGVRQIVTEDLELGEQIERRLTVPAPLPRIMVAA